MPLSPEDCCSQVVLRDERRLYIRAIRPEDRTVLLDEFRRLRPASVRARFFSNKKELSAEELRYFTEVDFSSHVALVAELRDGPRSRPAGVGRMVRTDEPGHAELALTVAEGLHGLGIGTALLKQLARLAPVVGLRYLESHVLAQNEDMLDVFRHSGFSMHTESERGTVMVTLDIGGG